MQKQMLWFGTGLVLVIGLGVWKSRAGTAPPPVAPPPALQGGLIDGSDETSSGKTAGDADAPQSDAPAVELLGDVDATEGNEEVVVADAAPAADTTAAGGVTGEEPPLEPPPPPTAIDPEEPSGAEPPAADESTTDQPTTDEPGADTPGVVILTPDAGPEPGPDIEPRPGTVAKPAADEPAVDGTEPDADENEGEAAADGGIPKPRKLGKRQDNGLLLLTFEDLSFFEWFNPHDMTPEEKASREDELFLPPSVPDEVLALEGSKVIVEGFMIPMEFKDGQVTSFLLAKSLQGCCYGVSPLPHELVEVTMPEGEGSYYVQWEPVYVTGKLTIKIPSEEMPAYAGIYHMVAESVDTFD